VRLLALLILCLTIAASEPPQWVVDGILMVETKSYHRDDGSIRYVDKRRGTSGEYGPYQMTRAAFKQVKRRGEQFWMLETNHMYAEEMAIRYLRWIDTHYSHGNWHRAIEMYNAGPNNHSRVYLTKVLEATP